jgi:hypothetical protein
MAIIGLNLGQLHTVHILEHLWTCVWSIIWPKQQDGWPDGKWKNDGAHRPKGKLDELSRPVDGAETNDPDEITKGGRGGGGVDRLSSTCPGENFSGECTLDMRRLSGYLTMTDPRLTIRDEAGVWLDDTEGG